MSRISLYKLDPDKLTTPFESAHQFTLVCTVSDSKIVLGCHYKSCLNHILNFVLTIKLLPRSKFVQSSFLTLPGLLLPLLYTDLCLIQPWLEILFLFCERFESVAVTIGTLPRRFLYYIWLDLDWRRQPPERVARATGSMPIGDLSLLQESCSPIRSSNSKHVT